jgi:hypothetical protein
MYRVIPNRFLVLMLAWLAVGLCLTVQTANDLLHMHLRVLSVPGIVWLVLNLVVVKKIWRPIWRWFPGLSRWFPDLNGVWRVTLCSNWHRQLQLVSTPEEGQKNFDIRTCPEDELAPLVPLILEAEIHQSWWKIEMCMTNPSGNSPIKRSEALDIEPFPGKGLTLPAISYFFKQQNSTANLSDDTEFFGAARLEYEPEKDRLQGVFWTSRMWRRALNTAGTIQFERLSSSAT